MLPFTLFVLSTSEDVFWQIYLGTVLIDLFEMLLLLSCIAAGGRVICKVWRCNYSRQCQYLYLYLHLCSMAARIF